MYITTNCWYLCRAKQIRHPLTPSQSILFNIILQFTPCRSQWPRGLRRGSAAARFLGLWVQIPPGTLISVCCECCVLSGRGLCIGLITRPEWVLPSVACLNECDHDSSIMSWPWSHWGHLCRCQKKCSLDYQIISSLQIFWLKFIHVYHFSTACCKFRQSCTQLYKRKVYSLQRSVILHVKRALYNVTVQ